MYRYKQEEEVRQKRDAYIKSLEEERNKLEELVRNLKNQLLTPDEAIVARAKEEATLEGGDEV